MTTNANTVPPGWHPDPSNPGGALRWWDGIAWTTHTQQAAPSAPQAAAPAAAWPGGGVTIAPNYGTANYGGANSGSANYGGASSGGANYGGATYAPAAGTFAQRNRHSLTAIGVVALYVLLAMTTHFVLIGIVPIMLSIRAIKAKETLAPAAVAAAIIAVVVAFSALS
jgi:hypothetical protein